MFVKTVSLLLSLVFLLALFACRPPLRVEPYLNGRLEGHFSPDSPEGTADAELLASLDLAASEIEAKAYLFAGSVAFAGNTYKIRGEERVLDYDRVVFISPQDRYIGSKVVAQVMNKTEIVYCISGHVVYGTQSGIGTLPKVSATLKVFEPGASNCEELSTFVGILFF